MPRRPSAPAVAAARAVLVQPSEPQFAVSQHASSQLTIEIGANRYQKVVGALAGRLKNRVGPAVRVQLQYLHCLLAPVQLWTYAGHRRGR